jgi:fatty acid desaturase
MSQAVTVHAAFTGALSMRFASALCSFITYLAFTPMHDACHGSVATEPSLRFLNDVVGTTCGALFPCPFPAFKRMHLLHHKHTNEEHLDPDGWVAKGPFFLLPLRWITIEVSYYSRFDQHPLSSSLLLFAKLLFRYIPEIFAGRRPRSEALQSSSLHCAAYPRIQTLAS